MKKVVLHVLCLAGFAFALTAHYFIARPDETRAVIVERGDWLSAKRRVHGDIWRDLMTHPARTIRKLIHPEPPPPRGSAEAGDPRVPVEERREDARLAFVANSAYVETARRWLDEARRDVDLHLYQMAIGRDAFKVVDALKAAQRRGVRVNVRLGDDHRVRDVNAAARRELLASGIGCEMHQGRVMHTKALFIDGEALLAGSHNWSHAAFSSNTELSIAVRDRTIVRSLRAALDATLAGGQPVGAPERPPAAPKPRRIHGVNINDQPIHVLTLLPGIGEQRARAIIQYRNSHGPFKTIQEITNVPGISPALFAEIKDRICVRHEPRPPPRRNRRSESPPQTSSNR